MITSSLTILASEGPFGPTVGTCSLFLVVLVLPFILLALTARSLLSGDPISIWLVGLMVIGAGGLAFLLWPVEITSRGPKWLIPWQIMSIGAILLQPLVLLREAGKRNWFRPVGRRTR